MPTPPPTPATGKPRERKILLVFYNATQQGDGWLPNCKVGWSTGEGSHCSWNGITCDVGGFVTKISLGGCGLRGVFPTPSIFTFEKLQWVQMPTSQSPYVPAPGARTLEGPLPNDLSFTSTLQRLELYGNTFNGKLAGQHLHAHTP
jgi:hypothetical protein